MPNAILTCHYYMCDHFDWIQICAGFLLFIYICIAVGDPIIKRRVGTPIASLTLPHMFDCPKPGPE